MLVEKGLPQAMYCLYFLVLVMMVSSCTSIRFHSSGLIPLYLTSKKGHSSSLSVKGQKQMFLWGLISPDTEVLLDEMFYEEGFIAASAIDINTYQKRASFWKAFFSLGFYIPIDYEISGKGISPSSREYQNKEASL